LEPLALQLTTVLVLGVLSLAALGVGAPLLRLLPEMRGETGSNWWTLVLASGAGGLMAWAGLLAALHALRPAALGIFLVVAGAAGVWFLVCQRLGRPAPGVRLAVVPVVLLGLAALVSLAVLPAFLPMYDTLNYHLGMPFQWLRASGMLVFPRDVYSLLPSNVGLVYAYALGLAGPWAAQAVHWWLGAITLAGVVALGRQLVPLERERVWGAALLATTPVFLAVSTVAYSDLGTAAFAAAAWVLALRGTETPYPGTLRLSFLAGLAAGAAFGCKYTSGLTLVVPLLGATFLVSGDLGSWKRRLANSGVALAGFVTAFLPWALRNLTLTGNPVYPYLGRLWSALGIPTPSSFPAAAGLSKGLGALSGPSPSLVRILSLGAAGTPSHGGLVGPVFLVLLPVTLWFVIRSWRTNIRVRILAVGSILAYVGWLLEPPLGRYLVAGLVPLAALTGAAVAESVKRSSRPVAVTLMAGLLFLGLWNVSGSLDRVWPLRLTVALGQKSPSILLERFASYWPAVRATEEILPANATLLLVAESRTAFWERNIVVEDPFHRPFLVMLAESSTSAQTMAETLRAMGVTHVLVNEMEERRIARMMGRQTYLETSSAVARNRLIRFLRSQLTPVWRKPGLILYDLHPSADQSGS